MDIFDKYCKKYDDWYDRNKFAYMSELEAIKKVLPKKGECLEIGVGTGRFAVPLGIATGIDPSKKMVEIAGKRGVNVKLGTGENLPFSNAGFDCILMVVSISFVENPRKVIEESHRVLKNNGKIVMGIIDRNSFLGKFYQKKKSVFYKSAHLFSVDEVSDLLKAAGFKQVLYYQTLFDLPEKMNSVDKLRNGFGKGGFVIVSASKI